MIRPAVSTVASLALVTCIPYWDSRSAALPRQWLPNILPSITQVLGARACSQAMLKQITRIECALNCATPLRRDTIMSPRAAIAGSYWWITRQESCRKRNYREGIRTVINHFHSMAIYGAAASTASVWRIVLHIYMYHSVWRYDPRELHLCRFDALCSYTGRSLNYDSYFVDTLHRSVWVYVVFTDNWLAGDNVDFSSSLKRDAPTGAKLAFLHRVS